MKNIKDKFTKLVNYISLDSKLISGNYFFQLISGIYGIYIANQISPEAYGVFGFVVLLITYLKFLNFGAQYIVNKKLSIKNENKFALDYLNINVYLFPVVLALILLILYLIGIFSLSIIFYFFLFFYLSLNNTVQIIEGVLRARDNSKLLGYSRFFSGMIILILLIVFYDWGNDANPLPLFLKTLCIPIATLAFLFTKKSVRSIFSFKINFSYKGFYYFLLAGISLGLYVFSNDLLMSIDRLFISMYYSTYDLGIYSFAYSLGGPVLMIITTIVYMDYSRYMNSFKKINYLDFIKVKREITKKFFLIYFAVILLSIPAVYLLLNYFLNQYSDAFPVVLLVLLSYSTVILSFPYSLYFISNNMVNILVKIMLSGLFLSFIINHIICLLKLDYIYLLLATFLVKICIFYLMHINAKKISFKN